MTTLIGAVPLSDSTEILFYLDTYKNKRYAKMRKFVKTNTYTGPTKSGLNLTPDNLKIIYESLKNISTEITNLEESELCRILISKFKGIFIFVRIAYYNGNYGIDIREYFEIQNEMQPTKKGVRIPFEYLSDTRSHLENMLKKISDPNIDKINFNDSESNSSMSIKEIEGVPSEYASFF